jgi:hypothetical protein
MDQPLAGKHSDGSNPVFMKTSCVARKTRWIAAQAVVLALMLLCQGFKNWDDPPLGQPAQMRSRVTYDAKLSDPFFESEEWICPGWLEKAPDGRIINRLGGPGEKELPAKRTAKCFTNSFGDDHSINFCDAKLIDDHKIELFIHDSDAPTWDNLKIVVQDGVFRSQYWVGGVGGNWMWTTKRQKLTLDKKVYRKGDTIKGRIFFECVEECVNPRPRHRFQESPDVIKIQGVIKTIVK